MRPKDDLELQEIGDWLVLNRLSVKNTQSYWECMCRCGEIKEIPRSALVQRTSLGCGCKRVERFSLTTRSKNRADLLMKRQWKAVCSRSKRFSNLPPLSFDEFKNTVTQKCFYCGVLGSRQIKDFGSKNLKTVTDFVLAINGLDRIDSTKGYELVNVVSCCLICNRAKNTLSTEEFMSWIKQVYEKQFT
jgi:hypothetical protein